MNSTFGAPAPARTGAGQAGVDSSAVRPITPGNTAPGPYSTTGMQTTPEAQTPLWPYSPAPGPSTRHPPRGMLVARADRLGATAPRYPLIHRQACSVPYRISGTGTDPGATVQRLSA